MNMLLVEDLDSKALVVQNTLKNICGADAVITRAKSVSNGLNALTTGQFDLLVLDLMLPLRDGGIPQKNSGTELLHEIINGTTVRRPTHVICLTEYPGLAKVLDSQIQLSIVHIVEYDEGSDKWREVLQAKCAYILKRLKEAQISSREHLTDVAFVTSSPIVEITEVLKLDSSFTGEFNRDDALHYYLSQWKSANNKDLRIVACAAPQMGMTAACVTTSKLIERWRPKLIVMAGITAGTKEDLNFGDILVGEIVFDYGSGKIVDSRSGKRVFVPDPRPLMMDVELKALLQAAERTQDGIAQFMKFWQGKSLSWTPKLRLGVLASGAAVVQSKGLVDEILKTSRKTVGLDMEAYGVFHAAVLAPEPRPRVLIAKSVSDYADIQKSDDWQHLAAFTSARFLHSFLTNCAELRW